MRTVRLRRGADAAAAEAARAEAPPAQVGVNLNWSDAASGDHFGGRRQEEQGTEEQSTGEEYRVTVVVADLG